ncbi:MAG: DUF5685 family protein [Oscillospiraceae bacterium]|nr:DUF5685 family protein [Oscillospiraceae bacterium]
MRCELRLREWEYFKATYCGLCHALARRYGFLARFLLGYDFTTLALAMAACDDPGECTRKRCPANPFSKRPCLAGTAFDHASDLAVLLFISRLRDTVKDETFLRGLPSRLGLLAYARAGRRAAKRQPAYNAHVAQSLDRLRLCEQEHTRAIDPPADAFASLLSGLAGAIPDEAGRRILGRMLYHLGRWIYLIDACDDLADDAKAGRYNPIAARFMLEGGAWTPEAKSAVRETAQLSRREIEAALQLMPETRLWPVLENIFVLGLPSVEEQVLGGSFQKRRNRPHERPV